MKGIRGPHSEKHTWSLETGKGKSCLADWCGGCGTPEPRAVRFIHVSSQWVSSLESRGSLCNLYQWLSPLILKCPDSWTLPVGLPLTLLVPFPILCPQMSFVCPSSSGVDEDEYLSILGPVAYFHGIQCIALPSLYCVFLNTKYILNTWGLLGTLSRGPKTYWDSVLHSWMPRLVSAFAVWSEPSA